MEVVEGMAAKGGLEVEFHERNCDFHLRTLVMPNLAIFNHTGTADSDDQLLN